MDSGRSTLQGRQVQKPCIRQTLLQQMHGGFGYCMWVQQSALVHIPWESQEGEFRNLQLRGGTYSTEGPDESLPAQVCRNKP